MTKRHHSAQPTPSAGSIDSFRIILFLAILPSSKHDYIRDKHARLELAMRRSYGIFRMYQKSKQDIHQVWKHL
jgi:hypothetical protein